MKSITILFLLVILPGVPAMAQENITWQYFSTEKGDLEVPNGSAQQTSCATFDVDNDGINDFLVTERVVAPSVVWYRRNGEKWDRYILDRDHLRIEAGSAFWDIDGDGDLDPVFGGEWESNELWWWENPFPHYDPATPWKRHTIKKSGMGKHHDQMFVDFDGDGRMELVFWNQRANTLFWADIPGNPRGVEEWEFKPVYTYSSDGEMQPYGEMPGWKNTNEHEGLAKADIDLDGVMDIVGAGWWFKYLGEGRFQSNVVDAAYSFSRSAAGQLIGGGRPEIVLVVGDGLAPMFLYTWVEGTWERRELLPAVDNGHSLELVDFNGDGHLDIFNAEMRFSEDHNPKSKCRVLLGDGKGNFTDYVINEGYSHHESRMADLDGDGDLDVLAKPYAHRAPGIDIWLQNGTGEQVSKRAGSFRQPFGLQLYSMRFEFQKDVPATLAAVKAMGIDEVEVSGYYGMTAREFKKLLDRNRLKCGSMIFGYEQFENDIETVIAEARLFGARYVGIGWISHEGAFGNEQAGKAIRDFNAFGARLRKAGLRFFYHPHGYEFNTPDGNLMDRMLAETDPQLVTFQMDVFWTTHGGADPLHYLRTYPGRFELMHLKELRMDTPGNNSGGAPDETSVSLGQGVTNWPLLLRQAVKSGTRKFYIEDEAKNAVEQVPVTIEYLNSLR